MIKKIIYRNILVRPHLLTYMARGAALSAGAKQRSYQTSKVMKKKAAMAKDPKTIYVGGLFMCEEGTAPHSQQTPVEERPWSERTGEILASVRNSKALADGLSWVYNRSAIFISLDLEQWERNNSILTEIGISVYDPADQVAGSPISSFPVIKAGHYIIKENTTCYNGKFVANHKFHFSYGQSLIMDMGNCKKTIREIFDHYENKARQRNQSLVIVGHDVKGDLAVLEKEKFSLKNYPILDTLKLWQANPSSKFGSLKKVLQYLNIPHGLLHNAGNDAYLTLQLMLCLCDQQFRSLKNLNGVIEDTVPKGKPDDNTSRKTVSAEAVSLFLK